MADEETRAEAIGGRMISTARRLSKQGAEASDIVRLALAGLMLVDSQYEENRACKVLAGIASADKNRIIDGKLKAVKARMECECCSAEDLATGDTTWYDFGRKIDEAAAATGTERLRGLSDAFCSLAEGLSRAHAGPMTVARFSLAAAMLVDNDEAERRAVAPAGSQVGEIERNWADGKCGLVSAASKVSFKSFIRNLLATG